MIDEAIRKELDSKAIYKAANFNNKVLIVNGWEGCGKTCVSSVFKSISNSEVMRYSYELEWICYLWMANKLDSDTASVVIRSISDLLVYNHMQSREVNFRPGDLSSIFRSPIWYKYIFRLFNKGGYECETNISKSTVLHLVTHKIYDCRNLLREALGSRLIHIEVVRDPIYMLKQYKFNQDTLHKKKSPRDFSFRYVNNGLPVYDGWDNSDSHANNNWELAVRFLERRFNNYFESTNSIIDRQEDLPHMIFFEDFVKNPSTDIKLIEQRYDIKFGKLLNKYLRIERIPRSHHSDARSRPIYKKIGWVKLSNDSESISDVDSYVNHYRDIGVPASSIDSLLKLSQKYISWKDKVVKKYR